MHSMSMTPKCCLAVLVLSAGLLSPRILSAQAAPGPMSPTAPTDSSGVAAKPQPAKPPVQPRTAIFGGWKLNRDDSDDPRKRAENREATTVDMAATGAWAEDIRAAEGVTVGAGWAAGKA